MAQLQGGQTQDAVDAFLAEFAGLAPATVWHYTSVLGPFAADNPELPRDPEVVVRWVSRLPRLYGRRALGVMTRRSYYKVMRLFYSWVKTRMDLSLPTLPYEGFGRRRRRW